MRSGFVAVVGRPNVGKSTLVNQIIGQKVAITSDKPQTTRTAVHGVLHREGTQVVFVDTPGLQKPRGALGSRLNQTARGALEDVDVTCVVVDAQAGFGSGDRYVAAEARGLRYLVLNKVDAVGPPSILAQLDAASDLEFDEYFPVSARTGEAVDTLVDHLVAAMPEGPPYFPADMVTDAPQAFRVAELIREQLLHRLRDELPHSVAVRVTEWAWPWIRAEILVERESQKPIVIGRGGELLKQVGTAVRAQLEPGAFLELHVAVDDTWTERADTLDTLGY